jgi:hypothetical protein
LDPISCELAQTEYGLKLFRVGWVVRAAPSALLKKRSHVPESLAINTFVFMEFPEGRSAFPVASVLVAALGWDVAGHILRFRSWRENRTGGGFCPKVQIFPIA